MKIENNTITNFEQDKILTIPKEAEEISWDALELNDEMAEKIIVENGNEKFTTNGTVLIDKNKKSIVLGLKNAEIPFDDSVTMIDDSAFLNRKSLVKIRLQNNIKHIGYRAFAGSGIDEIVLPEQLESIDSLAFWGCKSLKKIFISKTVKKIGKGILAGCDSLKEIIIDKENKNYFSINNCLIERESMTVIACPNNCIIPNGVRAIGEATFFMNTNCSFITIPESVEEIKENEICENFKFCGVYSKDDSGKIEKSLTIITTKGSFAEKYAKEKGIKTKIVNTFIPYPLNFVSAIFGMCHYGDGIILNEDLMLTIESMIADLNKEEREVFDYFYVNYMSREEVANILDISIEDVNMHLARTLRRCRHPSKSKGLHSFLVNNGIVDCYSQEEMDFEDIEKEGE